MNPENKDLAYLWDMLQAANDILAFVDDLSFEQFSPDKRTRYAVERQLLVIGEAATRVSTRYRSELPHIPWKQIVGLRNVLAHEYGEVLVERIWMVAKNDIPKLAKDLEAILSENCS